MLTFDLFLATDRNQIKFINGEKFETKPRLVHNLNENVCINTEVFAFKGSQIRTKLQEITEKCGFNEQAFDENFIEKAVGETRLFRKDY